jgi:hypothetical protein
MAAIVGIRMLRGNGSSQEPLRYAQLQDIRQKTQRLSDLTAGTRYRLPHGHVPRVYRTERDNPGLSSPPFRRKLSKCQRTDLAQRTSTSEAVFGCSGWCLA